MNLNPASAAVARPASEAKAPPDPARIEALRTGARALEAGFLSEMLRAAEPSGGSGFESGGESQFASFLTRERAGLMVDAGGIGLAEVILKDLIAREGGA